MRRRELLRLLLVAAGAVPAAARASIDRAWPADTAGLSARDVRLADLGARFAAADPVVARTLAGEAAARLGAPGAAPGRGARRARAALLGAAARERDLARGALVSVDGWLLTRSEAACCAYLHAVRAASAGSGARLQLG